jgi:hypothetical protein
MKKKIEKNVIVLSNKGETLMPTSSRFAKWALRRGKAVIVRRDIFTIQLKYEIKSRND